MAGRKKYKYFVTDGIYAYGFNSISEARKYAKYLAEKNQKTACIVKPVGRELELETYKVRKVKKKTRARKRRR